MLFVFHKYLLLLLHFVTRVHLAVPIEFVAASKRLGAELALVALLPGVDVAMPRQLVPLRKGLGAELTWIATAAGRLFDGAIADKLLGGGSGSACRTGRNRFNRGRHCAQIREEFFRRMRILLLLLPTPIPGVVCGRHFYFSFIHLETPKC